MAQAGPWKLARALAERETPAGSVADVASVDHLFWWDGDLTFLDWLTADNDADDARLKRALTTVGKVVDYHNTTGFNWKRRVKGGGGSGAGKITRSFGEAPPDGTPTLCDEMRGWTSECLASDHERCEAFVSNSTTCAEFCDESGMWCEGSWDDVGGGCVKEGASKGGKGGKAAAIPRQACETKRSSQICKCKRGCSNEGPWDCHEEGCPARSVTCEILSVACRASFSDIWRKPPYGMAGRSVAQACPLSCGVCTSMRPDAAAAEPVPAFLQPPKR